jgi:hypothetical protein
MKKEEFAIAFSERDQEEAIKEASLKIKVIFPKAISYLIILFTPHYNPSNILKTINLTLKPQKVLGIESPFLIFEEKIIQKGIVVLCMNKENLKLQEFFSSTEEPQKTESLLRFSFKEVKKRNFSLISFLSPSINPSSYLSDIRLSFGEIFNHVGAGYTKRYSAHTYQIANDYVKEGFLSIMVRGMQINSVVSKGYLPLGKPFAITKVALNRNIIKEINNKPAINMYKHFLEDKFDNFIKNNLFSFYPLGIKRNDSIQLVSVSECLEDGSLLCVGELKEKSYGHIMLLDSELFFKELKSKIETLKENGEGLIFVINSLSRKKILKDSSEEELKLIKKIGGEESKIIGLYSDYSFSPDEKTGYMSMEAGNLLVTLWH